MSGITKECAICCEDFEVDFREYPIEGCLVADSYALCQKCLDQEELIVCPFCNVKFKFGKKKFKDYSETDLNLLFKNDLIKHVSKMGSLGSKIQESHVTLMYIDKTIDLFPNDINKLRKNIIFLTKYVDGLDEIINELHSVHIEEIKNVIGYISIMKTFQKTNIYDIYIDAFKNVEDLVNVSLEKSKKNKEDAQQLLNVNTSRTICCKCSKKAELLCTCADKGYCSRECQKADWPSHKDLHSKELKKIETHRINFGIKKDGKKMFNKNNRKSKKLSKKKHHSKRKSKKLSKKKNF